MAGRRGPDRRRLGPHLELIISIVFKHYRYRPEVSISGADSHALWLSAIGGGRKGLVTLFIQQRAELGGIGNFHAE